MLEEIHHHLIFGEKIGMELGGANGRAARIVTWILVIVLILIAIGTLNQMTTWQNSIRLRMEMMPIDNACPVTVLCLAIGTAFFVILRIIK